MQRNQKVIENTETNKKKLENQYYLKKYLLK